VVAVFSVPHIVQNKARGVTHAVLNKILYAQQIRLQGPWFKALTALCHQVAGIIRFTGAIKRLLVFLCCIFVFNEACAQLSIKSGLFDLSDTNSLGLPSLSKAESFVAYRAVKGESQYNHGAVLFPFKGKLYLQWQSSIQDEDAKETVVMVSTSSDGKTWSTAKKLVPARKKSTVTNGGFWSDGKTLVAFINVWPHDLSPRGGHVEYITSKNGEAWSEPKALLDFQGQPVKGVIEQDLKALPNGRILTAVHLQPGLKLTPFYTDDPLATSAWRLGRLKNLAYKPHISRELEPSWYLDASKHAVMIFRDQGGSFKVLSSVSEDNGESWSTPKVSNMPDSRAKLSAGNLPNGIAYIVNNPSGEKRRSPLVLSLSKDGKVFDKAFALHTEEGLPKMRFEGKYKRIGYSYPKSIVWNDALWVSYAVNKEDIAVTKVPISELNRQYGD